MNIEKALVRLCDIIVSNQYEKADVINILHMNDVPMNADYSRSSYPQLISLLCDPRSYDIIQKRPKDYGYNEIPAADFIASNTPQS